SGSGSWVNSLVSTPELTWVDSARRSLAQALRRDSLVLLVAQTFRSARAPESRPERPALQTARGSNTGESRGQGLLHGARQGCPTPPEGLRRGLAGALRT